MGSSMLGLRRGRGNKVGKGGDLTNTTNLYIYVYFFFNLDKWLKKRIKRNELSMIKKKY